MSLLSACVLRAHTFIQLSKVLKKEAKSEDAGKKEGKNIELKLCTCK